jgi:hypothetical protein
MTSGYKLPVSIFASFLCVCVVWIACADMTFTREQVETSSDGKSTRVGVTTYITSSKLKSEKTDGSAVIIDLDEMKMIEMDRVARKYSRTDLNAWASQMKSAPGFSKFKSRFKTGKKTKTIGDYQCREVVAKMGPVTRRSWVTADIRTDTAVVEFHKNMAEAFPDVPLITSKNELWRYYLAMKSFPVELKIESKVKVGRSTVVSTTKALLKNYTYDKIAPETFIVPQGYTPLIKPRPE